MSSTVFSNDVEPRAERLTFATLVYPVLRYRSAAIVAFCCIFGAAVVAASGQAVFAADDLPALPGDRIYQLWLIDRAGIHSRGVIDLSGGSGQELVQGVSRGSSLAVSVEPEGGSKQPTTNPILTLEV